MRFSSTPVLAALLVTLVAVGCAPGAAVETAPPPSAISSPVAERVIQVAAEPTFGPSGETQIGRVVRITDGDTIRVVIDGTEHRLRYIGIDTPESVAPGTPVEPFALAATAANAALVEDRSVVLEKDVSETDRFDRLLRYVWLPPSGSADAGALDAAWRLVNLELIAAGLAEAVDYPPDTKYSDLFHAAEADAREAAIGRWAAE